MSFIVTDRLPTAAQDPWRAWPRAGAAAAGARSPADTEAELVGLNGSLHRVWLQAIDLERGLAQLRLTPGGSVVGMRFDQLRSLSLTTPDDTADPGEWPPLNDGAGPFRIEFKDGQVLSGQALAFWEWPAGVLVQQRLAPGRLVRHSLFSRAGFRQAQGQAARTQPPAPAAFAATLPTPLSPLSTPTSPKASPPLPPSAPPMPAAQTLLHPPPSQQPLQRLRAALQGQRVLVPEDLPHALEACGQLALARLGDTLVALGHLSEAQLASALALQQRQPGQPLGELLIREGWVSREQQRQALEHKAGHPFVDLNRFPVAEAALRCLPIAAAQSFEALPICFLDRQLVVVTAHPWPPDRLKDLSYRCQRPLVPALPLSGLLARHIEHHYDRCGLAGPQWLD